VEAAGAALQVSSLSVAGRRWLSIYKRQIHACELELVTVACRDNGGMHGCVPSAGRLAWCAARSKSSSCSDKGLAC
jgi:hypothetical protein